MFWVGSRGGDWVDWGTMNLSLTPAGLGYRMPAEWETHSGTWLTWPRPEGISFPDKYETVPDVYAEFIRVLTAGEWVHINVWNVAMEAEVQP